MASITGNHQSWMLLWWCPEYPDRVIKGYHVNLQSAFNTPLPVPLLAFCYKLTSGRKAIMNVKTHDSGINSLDENELEMSKCDLRVLSDLICDRSFILGNEPTLRDVVEFANLALLLYIEKEVEYSLRDAKNDAFSEGFTIHARERAFLDRNAICSAPKPPARAPKSKDKANKNNKDGSVVCEKQTLSDGYEKGKGDEKEKEQGTGKQTRKI